MMADILTVADLESAKQDDTFHAEVITGKLGGNGADIDFATHARTGQTQKTLPATVNGIDWSYVGLFADGVTFTDKTDFAVDAVGTQWIYTGSLPFSATAGTVPSEPTYQVVHVKSASAISNASGGSVQDFIDTTTFKTVADMKAFTNHIVGSKVVWQGYYSQSDGGSNWGIVKTGAHVDDGFSVFSITADLYIEANIRGRVSILKAGARDRNTGAQDFDCTSRVQAIFDYLDTAYMSDSYQSIAVGGGEVFIPAGEFMITGTLFIGSSTKLSGSGMGSKFRFNPSTPLSFLKPKNKNFGLPVNVAAKSNWVMGFEDFYVCTEPTGGTILGYDGVNPVTEYNRNTLHCFDIYDSFGVSFERVVVSDFWQGTAFRVARVNEVFSYYQSINQCFTRDCKRDIETVSAFTIRGGSFSDRTNFPANTLGKDYSITIGTGGDTASGTSMVGVGVEGNATFALIKDGGQGTSITGCYLEAKKALYAIDASDSSTNAGGACYAPNHFGYTSAVLLNPVIDAAGRISSYTDGVKVSAGEPREIKIVEATDRTTPSFRYSVNGLTNSPSSGLFLQGSCDFLAGIYYELRRGATSNVTNNQANYYFVPAETGRGNNYTVWITLLVKLISEDNATIRVYNPTSGNRDMKKLVTYTNGWSLYGTYVTIVDGEVSNLVVRQNAGSTSPSRKIQFTCLRAYQNGHPAIPAPYIWDEMALVAPTTGSGNIGDKVWNPKPAGVGSTIGWVYTSNGFKSMGLLS